MIVYRRRWWLAVGVACLTLGTVACSSGGERVQSSDSPGAASGSGGSDSSQRSDGLTTSTAARPPSGRTDSVSRVPIVTNDFVDAEASIGPLGDWYPMHPDFSAIVPSGDTNSCPGRTVVAYTEGGYALGADVYRYADWFEKRLRDAGWKITGRYVGKSEASGLAITISAPGRPDSVLALAVDKVYVAYPEWPDDVPFLYGMSYCEGGSVNPGATAGGSSEDPKWTAKLHAARPDLDGVVVGTPTTGADTTVGRLLRDGKVVGFARWEYDASGSSGNVLKWVGMGSDFEQLCSDAVPNGDDYLSVPLGCPSNGPTGD